MYIPILSNKEEYWDFRRIQVVPVDWPLASQYTISEKLYASAIETATLTVGIIDSTPIIEAFVWNTAVLDTNNRLQETASKEFEEMTDRPSPTRSWSFLPDLGILHRAGVPQRFTLLWIENTYKHRVVRVEEVERLQEAMRIHREEIARHNSQVLPRYINN